MVLQSPWLKLQLRLYGLGEHFRNPSRRTALVTTSKYLIAACFLTASWGASAEGVPPKVQQLLQKDFPGHRFVIEDVVFGDLNQDGRDDLAALVLTTGAEGQTESQRRMVAVYFAQPKGGYRHFATSGDFRPLPFVTASAQIKKGLLLVTRSGTSGCCASWFENFRFKMRAGDLVLTGQKSSETTPGDQINDFGSSKNYLSNEAVFWRQVGKKRQEVRRTLQTYPLVKLRDFDYEGYEKIVPNERRGYIDENFVFHE